MNYRHAFHAGAFSDVMKHIVLTLVLEHLRAKPTPFCVIDTHAGAGIYDLDDSEARRTSEAAGGIQALVRRGSPHPACTPYLDAVRTLNPGGGLRWYPGSPAVARAMLRPQDRLVLMELHPEVHAALAGRYRGDAAVTVRQADGYAALQSFLPPRERRGAVLIDPPFEEVGEFARLAEVLRQAHRRWATGIYLLWYPIKERPAVWRFHEALAASGVPRILTIEFLTHDESTHLRLNGCGLAVINPPWRLDTLAAEALTAVHQALPHSGGGVRIDWLVPEEKSTSGRDEPEV